ERSAQLACRSDGAPESVRGWHQPATRRYLWGAVYETQGTTIAVAKTPDEVSLDLNLEDEVPLTRGKSSVSITSLIRGVANEVADFEGNVDLRVVVPGSGLKCGWSNPLTPGSRAAHVGIVEDSLLENNKVVAPGVRLCGTGAEKAKAGVVAEV